MKTTAMLDNISSAIERVMKNLQGGSAPTKKRMPLGDFVTYAIAQIEKAAHDEPAVAKRRLRALKRGVDDALTRLAKIAAEDLDSARVSVEVETAFAPTKADGDTPMAELTVTDDQSATEIAPTSIGSATGDSAFAENLDEVPKALQKMKAELDGRPGKSARQERSPAAKATRGTGARSDGGGDDWPQDLNTTAFRKGMAAADDTPTWGYDPAAVAAPEAE